VSKGCGDGAEDGDVIERHDDRLIVDQELYPSGIDMLLVTLALVVVGLVVTAAFW
jgi:hypothetical protein